MASVNAVFSPYNMEPTLHLNFDFDLIKGHKKFVNCTTY